MALVRSVLTDKNELFAQIKTWQDICADAAHYIRKRYVRLDDTDIVYQTVDAVDTLLIFHEFNMAYHLFQHDKSRYDAYRALNKKIMTYWFVQNNEEEPIVIQDLKKELSDLYHFFDGIEALKEAVTARNEQMTKLREDGDLFQDFFQPIRFKRLFLKRKSLFLGNLDRLITQDMVIKAGEEASYPMLHKEFRSVKTLLEDHADFAYFELAGIFGKIESGQQKNPVLKTTAPGMTAAADQEYQDYNQKLGEISKQINDKISAVKNPSDVDQKFAEDYNNLIKQRDILNLIVKEKEAARSSLTKLTDKAQSYVGGKISYLKQEAALEAGKYFFKKAASTLGQAVWNEISGKPEKNDNDAINKELALELGEAVLGALMGTFMGPAGFGTAASLLNMFRPQPPDPYMEEFSKINQKIDNVGQKVELVIQKIDGLYDGLVGAITVSLSKKEFNAHIQKIQSRLILIETEYAQVFGNKTNSITDFEEIKKLNALFTTEFHALMKGFWHKNYKYIIGGEFQLGGEQANSTGIAYDENALSYQVIEAFKKPDSYRRFHKTCSDLLNMIDSISALIGIYNELRPQSYSLMRVQFAFLEHDAGKRKTIFEELIKNQKNEADINTMLFASVSLLKDRIIGPQNFALYQRMMVYWEQPEYYSYFSGFYLTPTSDVNKLGERYRFDYENKGGLLLEKKQDEAYSRFYIHPDKADALNAPYSLLNFPTPDTHPRRNFDLKIALDHGDKLWISAGDNPGVGARCKMDEAATSSSMSFRNWVTGHKISTFKTKETYSAGWTTGNFGALNIPFHGNSISFFVDKLNAQGHGLEIRTGPENAGAFRTVETVIKERKNIYDAINHPLSQIGRIPDYFNADMRKQVAANFEAYETNFNNPDYKLAYRIWIGVATESFPNRRELFAVSGKLDNNNVLTLGFVETDDVGEKVQNWLSKFEIKLNKQAFNLPDIKGYGTADLANSTTRAYKPSFSLDALKLFHLPNYLLTGQSWEPGDFMFSNNNCYYLLLEKSGNLVLFTHNGYPVWSAEIKTHILKNGNMANPENTQFKLTMRTDGNLVVQGTCRESDGKEVTYIAWESNTPDNPGAYLTLQDDRNLVIYSKDQKALWASDTHFHFFSFLNGNYSLCSLATGKHLIATDNGLSMSDPDHDTSWGWKIERVNAETFTLTSSVKGKVLDGNSNDLYLHDKNSGDHQKWIMKQAGPDIFTFTSKATNKRLDADNSQVNPGDPNDSDYQKWKLTWRG